MLDTFRLRHIAKHLDSLVTACYDKEISWKIGAGEGIRTLDPDLGKVVLYP